ncbi:hypothetical protein ACH4D3_39540 [Streptomyces sp. NPDC018026]|uniref:hypothetical protein n=1 Tax=Streptomyces sp. NPDC018026 TaxID=3365031 RepID=UPI0037A616B0
MTDNGAQAGAGAAAPLTDTARARLLMACAACDLADLARAAVPVGAHEMNPDGTSREPGAVLTDAARVLAAAHRYLEAAAVYERVGGADWRLVGDILNVSPRVARVRFAPAEAVLRAELRSPDDADGLRAHILAEPQETALDLDDWVRRHQDGDVGLGTAPVSGGLLPSEPVAGPGREKGRPRAARPV